MDTETWVTIGLYISYALLGIVTVAAFVGMMLNIFQKMRRGIIAIGGVVGLVVIMLIATAISPGDLSETARELGYQAIQIKMVAGGLITFYVLLAITILLLIIDLLKNLVQGN